MYQTVLYSAEFLSPAIYSPDGEATLSAMEYSTVKDMPRGVQRGNTLCYNPQQRHVRCEAAEAAVPSGQ